MVNSHMMMLLLLRIHGPPSSVLPFSSQTLYTLLHIGDVFFSSKSLSTAKIRVWVLVDLFRASLIDYSYHILKTYSLFIVNNQFCIFGNGYSNRLLKSNHQEQGRGKILFIQVREMCVLVITKNLQVMWIGLVICWSTSITKTLIFWYWREG